MKYSLSRFSVDPKQIKSARMALTKLVASVQEKEPGLVYLVFQEPGRPVFFTLVSFEDEAAYRRHAQSRHAARFARSISFLCDGRPTFVELEPTTGTRRIAGIPRLNGIPASIAGMTASLGRSSRPTRRPNNVRRSLARRRAAR